jgi:dihydrofolate reductase
VRTGSNSGLRGGRSGCGRGCRGSGRQALAQARAAAGDGDVAIQGGATTINQYLAAGLIDELRLHIVPLTLGAGTRLFGASRQ